MGGTRSRSWPAVCHRASLVRAAALRSSALSLAKNCSIGLRSGAVGRQVEQVGAGRRDRLLNASHFVCGEIIHHHHVARLKRRRERLLDIGSERRTGHRPVEDHRRDDAALSQSGDEGGRSPVPMRHRSDQPLAASAAAVKTGHLGRQPGLVEKHEAGRIHVALPDPPAVSPIGNIGTVLLGRPQALMGWPAPQLK